MIRFANRWPETENAQWLKLFVEAALELVDQKSPDNYRVHTMSTTNKLREVRMTSGSVISKRIPKPAMRLVLDEANEALGNDCILESIIEKRNLELQDLFFKYDDTTEATQSRSKMLLSMAESLYRLEAEDQILSELKERRSKNQLLALTKLYMAEVCSARVDARHIKDAITKIFLSDDIVRATPGKPKRLFSEISLNDDEFSILVCGHIKYVSFVSRIFELKTFENVRDIPNKLSSGIPENFGQGDQKRIMVISGMPASDPFTAVRNADSLLVIPRAFAYLYPRRTRELLDENVYVVGKKTEAKQISRLNASGIGGLPPRGPKSTTEAVQKFVEFMFHQRVRKGRANVNILRSLNSAALASKSDDLESKLVTLWSAFEALLPEPSKEEGRGTRILHFAELIVPSATFDYDQRQFDTCYQNLKKCYGDNFRQVVLDHGVGISEVQKFASIFVGDQNPKQLLLDVVAESPLALNRLWRLHEIANNPSIVKRKILDHQRRVNWQLHRIYRERNDIVHSGGSSPFLANLNSNAFSYYRSVLFSLRFAFEKFATPSPFEAFQAIAAHQAAKHRKLTELSNVSRPHGRDTKMATLSLIFQDELVAV